MVHVRSYAMRLKVEDEEGLERESRRGEAADGKGSSITVDCAQSAPRSRCGAASSSEECCKVLTGRGRSPRAPVVDDRRRRLSAAPLPPFPPPTSTNCLVPPHRAPLQ